MKRILALVIVALLVATTAVQAQQKEFKVGLSLSGGGALGFAHIGALQALEEHSINVEILSGTSMGAIIGTIYAAGHTPKEILEFVEENKLNKRKNLLSFHSFKHNTGFSSHDKLSEALDKLMPHSDFDSLERKMIICATNMDDNSAEYVESGKQLNDFVVASASVPGVFDVKEINEVQYLDGGIKDNLPAAVLRDRCDVVIGFDVVPYFKNNGSENAIGVALNAMRMMISDKALEGKKSCDWYVECNALSVYNETGFKHYLKIYEWGYQTMIDYIKRHPEMVEQCASSRAMPKL